MSPHALAYAFAAPNLPRSISLVRTFSVPLCRRAFVCATASHPAPSESKLRYDDADEYSTAPRELRLNYGTPRPTSSRRDGISFGKNRSRRDFDQEVKNQSRTRTRTQSQPRGRYATAHERENDTRASRPNSRNRNDDLGPSRARYRDDKWGGTRNRNRDDHWDAPRSRRRDDERGAARERTLARNRTFERDDYPSTRRSNNGARNEDWGAPRARSRPQERDRKREDEWGAERDRTGSGERAYDQEPDEEFDWGVGRVRSREDMSEVQEALASGDDLVYGLQSVSCALRAGRRRLHTLYAQTGERGTRGGNDRLRQQIESDAVASALRIVRLNRGELNNLSGNRPHQGVVLRCGTLNYDNQDPLIDPKPEHVILALDEVKDPHNLGALLRTAAYLGARGVVVCAKNSAPLSPAVSRASAGVAEAITVSSTASMPRFLRDASARGWRVLGADAGKDAVDIVDIPTRQSPTIIVLGSEGEGIRSMVKHCCDNTVRIPRANNAPEQLDSLNVSVAGGLLLFHLLA